MSDEARPTIPGAFRARTTGSIADPPGPLHARRGGALPPLTVTKSFPTQLPEKRNAQEPPPAPATPNKAPRLAPPLQPLQGPTVIPRPNPPPYVAPPPPSAPFPVFEDARPQSWTTARPGPINRAPNRPPPVAQHTAVPGEEFDELAFCSTQYLVATSPAKKSSQSPVKSRLTEQNFWGLPEIVRQIYAKRGIERLYPWQTECLSNDNVLLRGRNLVYSVPTSGGKTLPAEIHLMRMVVLKEKKALLVLPFVSIVLEKARSMSAFGKELRFPIEPYYGSNGPIPAPPGKSLSICTIEKANLLINQMIEDKCLDEIGLVVVDELHMVGEPDRGAVLELLLAKVMHAGKGKIQVIGMSATTGDSLAELGRWLNAEVFTRPFRPVDLHEHYVIGNDIFNTKKQLVRKLTNAKANSVDDVLLHLVKEVVPNSCVLLFCCTKKETQDVAERLAAQLPEVETHKAEEKRRLLEHIAAELGTDIDKIDRTLSKTIVRGVAFHHSGLSSIERELIETAFLKKEICVLTCTSTLAAGVNLPAQRVILRGAKTGQVPLTVRKYMQMVGRAGRAGMESLGESFLCLEQRDKNFVNLLVGQPPESLVSSLKSPMKRGEPHEQKQHEEDMFQRLVSDGLCGGYISTRHEVESFMRCTLGWQQGATEIQKKAEDALERLAAADLQFVTAAPDEKSEDALEPSLLYVPTPLAKATYRSNFAPRDSRLIYDELRSALNSITLADPLHRLYLITPLYALPEPVWTILPSLVEKMDPLRKKAVKRVGISMDWLNIKQAEAAMGAKPKRDPNSLMQELRARRLWSAWILSLVLEKDHDIDAVIAEYVRVWRKLDRSFDPSKTDIKVDRGVVEMLVESASGFGHSLAGLCKRYSAETKTSPNEADRRLSPVWGELETLLLRLSKQLNHGVKEEELELVEIHGVKKARAHKLFAAGYRTVHSIARAKVEEMTTRVKFGPYADGIAKRIIDAAKALLLAKATAMKEQAAELLEASDLVPGEEVDAQMV